MKVSDRNSEYGPPAGSPVRVRLSRKRGWRMPPNTVNVSRPGRWGNPFPVTAWVPADVAVSIFRRELNAAMNRRVHESMFSVFDSMAANLHDLRGKNLACWCLPGAPCHADVLLELANAAGEVRRNAVTSTGLLADESKG